MLVKIKKCSTFSRSKGFTLIEVLIAMVILAIGFMAIAALQYKALKYNHDSYLRSQLNVLAFDLLDRMRINIQDLSDANATTTIGNYLTALDDYDIPTIAITGCNQAAAFTTANAITCWQQQLQNALPPGSNVDMSNGAQAGNYTLQISWQDKEDEMRRAFYTFQLF